MNHQPDLYLASSSPRRKKLLRQLGIFFKVVIPKINEQTTPGERPEDYVIRMAKEKALCGFSQLSNDDKIHSVVLGSDTIVVHGLNIYEKPSCKEDAIRMLSELSGTTHQVMTAVAAKTHSQTSSMLSISNVSFRAISAMDIEHYCNSKEPYDKAGAYAIQGKAAIFISHLAGSYSGVMGLPLYETAELLRSLSIDCLDSAG